MPLRTFSLAASLLLALVVASSAHAAVVTDMQSVSARALLNSPATAFGQNLAASFTGFDHSLGTLTGVAFTYDYEYDFSVAYVGNGGGGGGLNSGLQINGVPFDAGVQPAFVNLSSSQSGSVTGTISSIPPTLSLSTFESGFIFTDYAFGGFAAGGAPGFSYTASLDLLLSNVSVTYTYTPAIPGDPTTVPEPSTMALFGISALALALGRRRKAARS